MGKRSNFARHPKDKYDTPFKAVIPLLKHLPFDTKFIEPCAGNNVLVKHLEAQGHTCLFASDIEPGADGISTMDLFSQPFQKSGTIITNPPWSRNILHPLIEKIISENRIAWLLFDADWCHTKQSSPYLGYISDIVSVGRVKWIEGSKYTGKDNCAWYKIMPGANFTQFHGP